MTQELLRTILGALAVAAILALVKLFRDVDRLQTKVEPLLEWWRKTSMDALKIATNPTSERLTELAGKYAAHVNKGEPMSVAEKEELIRGLRELMNNPEAFPAKRQSASISLRFIEQREGLATKVANGSANY